LALTEHLAEWITCRAVPHAILNMQLVYCPHDQGFTMSCTLGDTSGNAWSHRVTRYGPFDDAADLGTDLAQYVRVMFRRTLLEASLGIHASDSDRVLSEESPEA
jgi:hypothetical protein